MKIAILNAEAGGNKGAEAMLETLILELLKRYDDLELYLEVASKKDYYQDVFLKRFDQAKLNMMEFTPKNPLNPYNVDVRDMDFAIDIGGISFHDGSNRGVIKNLIRHLPFAKTKSKLIYFTQDFGPSKKKINKFIARQILPRAAVIFTRSIVSHNEVIENFKVRKSNVHGPYPDSTLVFHPKGEFKLPNGLEKHKYVIFCPSAIMYLKYGQQYVDFFIKLYDKLKENYRVLILVHNFTLNGSSSDSAVCLNLKSCCPEALLFHDNVPSDYFKYIIKNAKYSISSRYHVVVGSVAQNVPSIAIGWNPKYESFLNLYDKSNWNIDFDDKAYQNVLNCIDNFEFNDIDIELYQRNITLEKKVRNSFKELFKVLDLKYNRG